jgi:thiamine biosynthesis lipoprotein
MAEAAECFACFGSTCEVRVLGGVEAAAAARDARALLVDWHARFTRFDTASELSRLNADPRPALDVSEEMAMFVAAARDAAAATGGLVDATLLRRLETLGYREDLRQPVPLALALRLAPPRMPAGPSAEERWRQLAVAGTRVTRPPGLGVDSGGIVKGLAADVLAERLAGRDAFAVDCAGDLRLGGVAALARPVQVQSPFDGSVLHTFELAAGGVATSGIGRRSWIGDDGRPAHHLLDPATGRPAFTGIVQATALAPTALEAEIRAKAAVLSGPDGAAAWLPDGGVIVLDSGEHVVITTSRS